MRMVRHGCPLSCPSPVAAVRLGNPAMGGEFRKASAVDGGRLVLSLGG
jgi:hypothetical protein